MNRSTHPAAVAAVFTLYVSIALATEPPQPPPTRAPLQIFGIAVTEVLARLGARLEHGTSSADLRAYAVQFDRTDLNGDGKHSRTEYVDRGRYLTAQARSGIFRAADGNHDGLVTRAEYILNRIITDEAKEIIEDMDQDRNRQIERAEFLTQIARRIPGRDLAEAIFTSLDANRDGILLTPEYLRIWGQWARSGQPPAEQRIASRHATLAQQPGTPGTDNTPGRAGSADRPVPPSVDQVFRRFDANGDAALDTEEVPPFVQQFVFPADANRDDKVTRDELKAFRGSLPGRQPRRNLQEDPTGPSSRRDRRGRPAAGGPRPPRDRGTRRGPPNPDQFIQQALQFDQDGDGKLDRQELLKFARTLTRRRGNDRLQRRPSSGFRDRDGGSRRSPPERGLPGPRIQEDEKP